MMRSVLVATFLLLSAGCGSGGGEILECTGECSCEDGVCTCTGGSECAVEGGGDATLVCDGNARCSLECGGGCHVICNGTSGCDVSIGDGATAICNGTGDCNYTCAGDCSIDCPGTSQCTVYCASGSDCEVTSCPQTEDCGDGVFACRMACPQ